MLSSPVVVHLSSLMLSANLITVYFISSLKSFIKILNSTELLQELYSIHHFSLGSKPRALLKFLL